MRGSRDTKSRTANGNHARLAKSRAENSLERLSIDRLMNQFFIMLFHFTKKPKRANGWWKLINLPMTERKIAKSISRGRLSVTRIVSLVDFFINISDHFVLTKPARIAQAVGSLNYFFPLSLVFSRYWWKAFCCCRDPPDTYNARHTQHSPRPPVSLSISINCYH